LKKKKLQNILIGVIALSIIGAIVAYNYSADQARQRGFQFGVQLEQIQQDVKDMQSKFYSEKTSWEEGDISKEELLEFYDSHIEDFRKVISRYDALVPPKIFQSSVELLKMSSETQLLSDSDYIEWIKTGDESAKVRSDTYFQESVEYEMQGLVEFYSAKTGVKTYDTDGEFEPPQTSIRQKVIQVAENMASTCDAKFKNSEGGFESDKVELDWFNCINDAKKWKEEHLQ
jgi:hypothetical protein